MRVRAESREYVHTNDKRKPVRARGYAIVAEGGKPLFIGLFVSEAKAEEYAVQRGWKFVKERTA